MAGRGRDSMKGSTQIPFSEGIWNPRQTQNGWAEVLLNCSRKVGGMQWGQEEINDRQRMVGDETDKQQLNKHWN